MVYDGSIWDHREVWWTVENYRL